jgi:hypothetical protein
MGIGFAEGNKSIPAPNYHSTTSFIDILVCVALGVDMVREFDYQCLRTV